jgi:hypothetical protein
MKITTKFNIGDKVNDRRDNEGEIDQIRVEISRRPGGAYIIYMVNFSGVVKSIVEDELV